MQTLKVLCVLGATRCSLVEFVIWALIFLIFKANLYYRRVIFQTNFKILLRINNLAHQFETPTTFKSMRECNLWSLGMLRQHLRLKLKNSIEGRQRTVHEQPSNSSLFLMVWPKWTWATEQPMSISNGLTQLDMSNRATHVYFFIVWPIWIWATKQPMSISNGLTQMNMSNRATHVNF